jgi:DNA topoisomerase-3
MSWLLSHVFRLTVQKDTPNRGRQFYACSKPQNERCNFFKWADDTNPGDDGRWAGAAPSGSTSGGRGAGRMLAVLSRNSRSVIKKFVPRIM